jgi:hypothetical protein
MPAPLEGDVEPRHQDDVVGNPREQGQRDDQRQRGTDVRKVAIRHLTGPDSRGHRQEVAILPQVEAGNPEEGGEGEPGGQRAPERRPMPT